MEPRRLANSWEKPERQFDADSCPAPQIHTIVQTPGWDGVVVAEIRPADKGLDSSPFHHSWSTMTMILGERGPLPLRQNRAMCPVCRPSVGSSGRRVGSGTWVGAPVTPAIHRPSPCWRRRLLLEPPWPGHNQVALRCDGPSQTFFGPDTGCRTGTLGVTRHCRSAFHFPGNARGSEQGQASRAAHSTRHRVQIVGCMRCVSLASHAAELL